MPKKVKSLLEKRVNVIEKLETDTYSVRDNYSYCKICDSKLSTVRLFEIRRHEKSSKHISALLRAKSDTSSYKVGQNDNNKLSTFTKDLCSALIAADIPFNKLRNKEFRQFLEKYTKNSIPHESTLRKTYVQSCYNDTMNAIRKEIGNHAIWISIDETTDVKGRAVGNVIVGTLENGNAGKKFLLHCHELLQVNNETITQLFSSSLQLLWPEGIRHENVLLFVTDGAAYMRKAGKNLSTLYPNMIHITCCIHGLHRVAEEIRAYYPDIDVLISSVKKVFLKAPSRIQLFKTTAPNLSLPPQPIVTRWGTWLAAAKYYAENYSIIKSIINKLPDDAVSVKLAKEILNRKNVQKELIFIKDNFTCIISAIKQLETSYIPLRDSLRILFEVRTNIEQPHIPDKIKNKMLNVLQKNSGLQILLTSLESRQTNTTSSLLRAEQLALFTHAPIVSCEVECSFSRYKAVLTDRRQNFTFENLYKYIVVHCNQTKQ